MMTREIVGSDVWGWAAEILSISYRRAVDLADLWRKRDDEVGAKRVSRTIGRRIAELLQGESFSRRVLGAPMTPAMIESVRHSVNGVIQSQGLPVRQVEVQPGAAPGVLDISFSLEQPVSYVRLDLAAPGDMSREDLEELVAELSEEMEDEAEE